MYKYELMGSVDKCLGFSQLNKHLKIQKYNSVITGIIPTCILEIVLDTLIKQLLTETTIYTIHTQYINSHKTSQFLLAEICNELVSEMCVVANKIRNYTYEVVKHDQKREC